MRSKYQAEERKVKELEKQLKKAQEEKTKVVEASHASVSKLENQLKDGKREHKKLALKLQENQQRTKSILHNTNEKLKKVEDEKKTAIIQQESLSKQVRTLQRDLYDTEPIAVVTKIESAVIKRD